MVEFRNESGLEFTNISSELWRCYVYTTEEAFRVDRPVALHVSESGGHRIFTEEGASLYIAPGWKALVWEAKEGQPHFVA
jgi:hypothetical protein